jgi:hypothetical protein
MRLLKNSLEACREAGIKHVVVVKTDAEFDKLTPVGDKYMMPVLWYIAYTYIKPVGKLENVRDYTYGKGIPGNLKMDALDRSQLGGDTSTGTIFWEDVAALYVQSLLSLDWNSKHIICL